MIRAHGASKSKIVLVSDYPTPAELANGKCLSGYMETYLKDMFKEAGVQWGDLYKTSIIKEKLKNPPKRGSRNQLKAIQDQCNWKESIVKLKAEILSIYPSVIVPLGSTPTGVFTGQFNVGQFKGSIMPALSSMGFSAKTKVIPIPHPRDIAAQYSLFFSTSVYIERIVEASRIFEFPRPNYTTEVIRSSRRLLQYLELAQGAEFITCDVETYRNHVTAIGFCADGKHGVSVPMTAISIGKVEYKIIYQAISAFLDSGIPIVNQNVGFDHHQLARFGMHMRNVVGDTMLMFGLLYPELPKNLGFLNSIYTDIPYFKNEGKEWDPGKNENLFTYNAKDCISTYRVWEGEVNDAKELGLWTFYKRGPQRFYYMYRRIEQRGIRLDENKRNKLMSKYQNVLSFYQQMVDNELGDKTLNINSPKQMTELLYYEMGLPQQYTKRADGNRTLSADEKALEFLAINEVETPKHKELLLNIIAIRKCMRILDFLGFFVHPDGRGRTRYKIAGTESGRTSTSQCDDNIYFITDGKLEYKKMGFSLQQFPKHGYTLPSGEIIGDDLRAIFVPSKGYEFGEWDQRQAEAVVVAVVASDDELLHRISTGDVHLWTAALVLDISQEAVTKEQRQNVGKRGRHAAAYEVGPKTLSMISGRTIAECTVALKRIHEISPKIRSVFQQGVRDAIKKDRAMTSPHGRRRDFLSRIDNRTFREGYSYIPQAVVSDHQKFCMLSLQEEYPTIEFLGEFHDGTFFEKPIALSRRQVAESITNLVKEPILFNKGTFIRDQHAVMAANIAWSNTNWNEMEALG